MITNLKSSLHRKMCTRKYLQFIFPEENGNNPNIPRVYMINKNDEPYNRKRKN